MLWLKLLNSLISVVRKIMWSNEDMSLTEKLLFKCHRKDKEIKDLRAQLERSKTRVQIKFGEMAKVYEENKKLKRQLDAAEARVAALKSILSELTLCACVMELPGCRKTCPNLDVKAGKPCLSARVKEQQEQ